jgi:hypothetical protein
MAGSLKLKIDNEALAEEFFEDAFLLGIVAPLSDYHFCWQINQSLGIDFRVNNDIEIQLTKKNRKYFFPIYEYPVPAIKLVHYLYNNQDDGEYLLPEFRHLDFLWLIKGEGVAAEDLDTLVRALRLLSGVQLVTEMTNEKIKNKQHLIF